MNDKDKKELDDLLSLTNPDSDLLEEFIYKLQEENKNLHKIVDTVYWQILPDGKLEMIKYPDIRKLENENKKMRAALYKISNSTYEANPWTVAPSKDAIIAKETLKNLEEE